LGKVLVQWVTAPTTPLVGWFGCADDYPCLLAATRLPSFQLLSLAAAGPGRHRRASVSLVAGSLYVRQQLISVLVVPSSKRHRPSLTTRSGKAASLDEWFTPPEAALLAALIISPLHDRVFRRSWAVKWELKYGWAMLLDRCRYKAALSPPPSRVASDPNPLRPGLRF